MITWEKISRTVSSEGTTITYAAEGTGYTIESRKRHIPHANGIGTWDHTSYFVLKGGVDIVRKYSLADAKAAAEKMIKEETE